jgi:hypothetical protein
MSQNQQIEQASGGNDKAESGHSKANPDSFQVYKPRRWLAVVLTSGLIIAGAGGFAWLYWTSLAFSDAVDGLKFLTEGSIALALLIVAVVQACVYWSQRGIMRGQWAAMLAALGEAKEQTRTAGDSLVISQQSYVGVQNIKWETPDLGDFSHLINPRVVLVEIGNVGNVPADHIRLFIEIMIDVPVIDAENPTRRTERRAPYHADYGESKLFKGNLPIQAPIQLTKYMSEDEIDLILQERGFIALYGDIEYTDGFGAKVTPFVFTYMGGNVWTPSAPESWKHRTKRQRQKQTTDNNKD